MFVVLASVSIAGPVLYDLIGGSRAQSELEEMKSWLSTHNAAVMATLWVLVRLDGLWRILRRAAGHDQRQGVLPRIFAWTAVVCGGGFLIWLILVAGPGSLLVPQQS